MKARVRDIIERCLFHGDHGYDVILKAPVTDNDSELHYKPQIYLPHSLE